MYPLKGSPYSVFRKLNRVKLPTKRYTSIPLRALLLIPSQVDLFPLQVDVIPCQVDRRAELSSADVWIWSAVVAPSGTLVLAVGREEGR